MELRNKGENSEDENGVLKEGAEYFPYGGDDLFLKKKPVNLFITIALGILAVGLTVAVARHYYRKVSDQERLKWETGRLNKVHIDKENSEKHDLFQPLRENWTRYITSEISSIHKGSEVFIVLNNRAPKPLDKVVVSVYSLNWNGEASGVKDFVFQNIKPQEIKRVKFTGTSKAKDVLCIIKSITASSFSFCFNKDLETGGKSDPYYCSDNGN